MIINPKFGLKISLGGIIAIRQARETKIEQIIERRKANARILLRRSRSGKTVATVDNRRDKASPQEKYCLRISHLGR